MQMVNLFLHKPDVYIRQLQVCMRISAINFPTPQRVQTMEIVQIGGQIQNTTFLLKPMPVFGSTFAVQIKCHSKTLDRYKDRK